MSLKDVDYDTSNTMVTSEEGKVLHIGKAISQYIIHENYRAYCHSHDRIVEGDTLVFVNGSSQSGKYHKLDIPCMSVTLSSYNPSKQLPYTARLEPNTLIETIFNGNNILIEWGDQPYMKINGFMYELHETWPMNFVIRGNKVVYFNQGFGEIRALENIPFEWPDYTPQDVARFSLNRDDLLADYRLPKETWGQWGFTFKDDFVIVESQRKVLDDSKYIVDHFKSFNTGKKAWHSLENTVKDMFPDFLNSRNKGQNAIGQKHYLKAYQSSLTIMITGESGVGKSRLAKEIHELSPLNQGPFVHVNCAAIPASLIESELFGYEKGAFTGASSSGKRGYFDLAFDGTLFLDEISEIPKDLQGKLLDALQSRSYYRVGGSQRIATNARIIVATNKDLYQEVTEGRFREDLYYRICVFPINIQPLRQRIHEIGHIMNTILPMLSEELNISSYEYSDEFLHVIKSYDWPGNIRELENVLRRALIISDDGQLGHEDLILPNQKGKNSEATLKQYLEQCEADLIETKLKEHAHDMDKIAQLLNISRSSLYEKMKKHGLGRR